MRAKILNASAGSGKTYQLAYKYVRDVIKHPNLYRHILAVTFTNKATEEMKSRILREIHALASGAESPYLDRLRAELGLDAASVAKRAAEVRAKILHDYSRFTVLTIDTFFQRILRAFIKELGLDLNYNVEIETASLLAKSADALIDEIAVDDTLQRWLSEFVQERIDEGRKWDVRDGILSLAGELFKEKNKERIGEAPSKERLAELVARASAQALAAREEISAIAKKALDRMGDEGLGPADFAGKSRSFANYFAAVAEGVMKPPTETVRKRARSTDGWCAKGAPAQRIAPELQPMLLKICDLYDANLKLWNTADLLRENFRSFALLADLHQRVQRICAEQNTLLLAETKYLLAEFIGRNDAPFIYEKVGNRFERFMIDEFQDTSEREWENFVPLLLNAMAQSEEESVLIVGDIKQSIYRWRGGDWRLLHEKARRDLGPRNTEVEALKENWRSLPQVVAFNNEAIGRIVAEDNRILNEALDEARSRGDIGPEEVEALTDTLGNAYRGQEQLPKRRERADGYVAIETFDDEPPVVERICQLIDRGFRPSDIMILVRSATDGAKVAEALLDFKQRNSIPEYRFDIMTQEALIVGNAPVSSFVAAALRLAISPEDRLSRAVCNHYLGREFDRPMAEEEIRFFRSIRLLSPEEAFERIVMFFDLKSDVSQIAYLQAIHEQIIAFCAAKIADIALFLKAWTEQGQNRSLSVEQSLRTIEITTIHKAKGLEKPAVIIPYCAWQLDPKSGGVQNIVWARPDGNGGLDGIGTFPVRYKKAMAESGFSADFYREMVYAHVDNVNLLYVALTRAAESLHIFIPKRSAARSVGTLLLQALRRDDEETVSIGGVKGRWQEDQAGEHFLFGSFEGPVAKKPRSGRSEHLFLDDYPTALPELRLRLPAQRYFEETDEPEIAPRNFGILMHRAFEQADDIGQVAEAVERMRCDGTIGDDEARLLRHRIDDALRIPKVREWFDGTWQRVRNEQEIIVPGSVSTRRPDRVMIRGTQVVVVDYKFGMKSESSHHRQVAEYIRLLGEMGYTSVEGFIWYVKRGVIEPVTS